MISRFAVVIVLISGCEVHSKDDTHLVARTPVETASHSSAGIVHDQPKVLSDGGRIVPPKPVKRVEPKLPQGMQASVTLVVVEAVVTKNGGVKNAKIVTGGSDGYSHAILDAVSQWKFRPGTVDGRPVDMPYTITVNIDVH